MSKTIPFVQHPENYPNPMFPDWPEADKTLWEIITKHTKVCVKKDNHSGMVLVGFVDLDGFKLIPPENLAQSLQIYTRFSESIAKMTNLRETLDGIEGNPTVDDTVITGIEVKIKEKLVELYTMAGISYRRLFWWMLSNGSVINE